MEDMRLYTNEMRFGSASRSRSQVLGRIEEVAFQLLLGDSGSSQVDEMGEVTPSRRKRSEGQGVPWLSGRARGGRLARWDSEREERQTRNVLQGQITLTHV